MKKSIRVCLAAAVLFVPSTSIFAAPTGGNPHPPMHPPTQTGGGGDAAVSVVLALLGL